MTATAQDLARRLARLRASRRWCFWVFANAWVAGHGCYSLSIVVADELGHYPTGEIGVPVIHSRSDDYDNACGEAAFLNRTRNHLTDRDTIQIVASAIGAPAGYGRPCFGPYPTGDR